MSKRCVHIKRNDCSRVIYKITKLSVLLCLLYIYASVSIIPNFTNDNLTPVINRGKHGVKSVTLLIAHPDDEVMFFAPSLLNLDAVLPSDTTFNIVCYSNGNAEGLGEVRNNELHDSINLLLSKRETAVTVLDHEDGMNVNWNTKKMLKELENIIKQNERKNKSNPGEKIILTFDNNGVSKHVNHIACYDVAMQYYKKNMKDTSVLTLQSYPNNIIKKYSFYLWELMKLFNSLWNPLFSSRESSAATPLRLKSQITIFSSFSQYILSLASMLNSHKTQMVWYRYAWWFFSRYVFVNDLDIIATYIN